MDENKVIALERPGADEWDALTEVLRQGASRTSAQTIEEGVEAFSRAARVAAEAAHGADSPRAWGLSG